MADKRIHEHPFERVIYRPRKSSSYSPEPTPRAVHVKVNNRDVNSGVFAEQVDKYGNVLSRTTDLHPDQIVMRIPMRQAECGEKLVPAISKEEIGKSLNAKLVQYQVATDANPAKIEQYKIVNQKLIEREMKLEKELLEVRQERKEQYQAQRRQADRFDKASARAHQISKLIEKYC